MIMTWQICKRKWNGKWSFPQHKHKPDKPKTKQKVLQFFWLLWQILLLLLADTVRKLGPPPHETNPCFYLLHCQRRRTTCLLGLDTQFIVLLAKWDTCGDHGMAKCCLSPTKIQKPYFVIESFVGLAIRSSHQDTKNPICHRTVLLAWPLRLLPRYKNPICHRNICSLALEAPPIIIWTT
jgi:hypothetical protein